MADEANLTLRKWLPVAVAANVVSPLGIAALGYLYFTGALEPAPAPQRPSDSPVAVIETPDSNDRFLFDVGEGWLRLDGEERIDAIGVLVEEGSEVSRRQGGRDLEAPPGMLVHRHRSDAILVSLPLAGDGTLFTAARGLSRRARSLSSEGFSMLTDEERAFPNANCHVTAVVRESLEIQSAICRPWDYPRSLFAFTLARPMPSAAEVELDGIVATLRAEAEGLSGSRVVLNVPAGVQAIEVLDLIRNTDGLAGSVQPDRLREGWLAPRNYVIEPGTARADVVARMVEAQEERLERAWKYRDPELPVATREELLVLAALVECESPSPEFLDPVASVFVNRLRVAIRLQSDAALVYGITGGKPSLERGLRQSDLANDTPWNTYVHDGLPPTPICSPSLAAIQSASQPPATDYLYFVGDADGGLVFAATLRQHNENVRAFRDR